jgi:hypothetical protein
MGGESLPMSRHRLEHDKKYIGMRGVQERYETSHMTIERKLHDDPDFPKPIYFGHQRKWRISELEEYERKLVIRAPRQRRQNEARRG